MALKTILFHADMDDQFDARLDMACELAIAHEAHLIGLHVIPNPYIPFQAAPGYVPAEFIESQRDIAEADAQRAEAAFGANTERHGVKGEWRTGKGLSAQILGVHARYADVTIVGQSTPARNVNDPELPSVVTMMAARPVIVVPSVGAYHDIGKRIMVCWNASREATRAVNDALPLLRNAEKVTVLAVNPKQGEQHGEMPGVDIAHYLSRHGIRAEANKTFVDDIAVGDLILSRAADLGIDLIVMGAYGHSRLQEWVFGGVTRAMMQTMTRPVLISH